MSSVKANTVLTAAIAFLVLSSCAAYFAFKRFQTSHELVIHTLEVQHDLDRFITAAGRAGRLHSEYIGSGDPVLLTRQGEASATVRSALSNIQQLTADNVTQQLNCQKLGQVTERRLGLMDQAVALRRSGKSGVEVQVAMSREMMSAADATDAIIRAMEDEEQRLLIERERRQSASFSIIAGVLLTSLFLALVFFLIHHQMITEQVRERLRAENAQRALSARLLNLQDDERRRFARELHDSVGQHLAAMKMGLSMLDRKLAGDAVVKDCLKLADDAISETRTISHLLHPPLLDEAGLNSAIRWFVEGFAKRSGININLHIQEGLQRFEDTTELVIFRALQESLTNVHRHSGAKRADVSLALDGNSLVLRVQDDGVGIPQPDLERFRRDAAAGGVGLAGMSERLREIGGRIEINSTLNGTQLTALVPVRTRVDSGTQSRPLPVQEVSR